MPIRRGPAAESTEANYHRRLELRRCTATHHRRRLLVAVRRRHIPTAAAAVDHVVSTLLGHTRLFLRLVRKTPLPQRNRATRYVSCHLVNCSTAVRRRLYKMWKMGWFRVLKGYSRSLKIAPFDRAHTSCYYPSIVGLTVSPYLVPGMTFLRYSEMLV